MATRAALLAAFAAQGIRTATTGTFSAPCIHVEPGDPWSVPVRMPGRQSRWRLMAIGGAADSDAALEAIAELVDRAELAIKTVAGAELPAWAKPADYTGGGGPPYAASIATISIDQYANGG